MSTAITEFYDALRVLLDDRHETVRLIEDAALLKGVRATIAMGKVPGYTLTADKNSVTPDIAMDGSGDPNKLALLLYHTVKLFVAGRPDRYSYKTRAMSESFGGWREFLWEIDQNIHALENGTMFRAWQDFEGYMTGISGGELWKRHTDVQVAAPFQTLNVNPHGSSVVSGSSE